MLVRFSLKLMEKGVDPEVIGEALEEIGLSEIDLADRKRELFSDTEETPEQEAAEDAAEGEVGGAR